MIMSIVLMVLTPPVYCLGVLIGFLAPMFEYPQAVDGGLIPVNRRIVEEVKRG